MNDSENAQNTSLSAVAADVAAPSVAPIDAAAGGLARAEAKEGQADASDEALALVAQAPGAGTDHDELRPAAALPVVGIGASAGGLEALESLIGRLSSDGFAYVIIQHLAPSHESLLGDILARRTSIPVVTISDGMRIAANHIYVTPPGAELSFAGGAFHLGATVDRAPRHLIDVFFRSLADEIGPRAVGIILSGAGSDGTAGLRAIKEAGGITFAQEPSTAGQSSMPLSAIAAGYADFRLNPAEIGDELMRLSAHPYVARKRATPLFGRETLARLFERLHRAYGVDFGGYKLSTIERRIERRMALQKLDRVDDYMRFIESNAQELGILYSDLLIGVTSFFRDKEPFEALKTLVFPRLFEKRSPDLPVRIWVPGCASGEEAYSIAICLLEYGDSLATTYKVQIFATDIDDQALLRARHAIYPTNIETDVSRERLQRFFSRQEQGYQLSRQIRDMVVFAHHNLGKDPPFSRVDLVSCRNLLIYMQSPLQKKVLRIFHYALNPDAFLLLGTSESVGDASDYFSLLDRKVKLYTKKNVASTAVFDFAFNNRIGNVEPVPVGAAPREERRPAVTIQQLADRKVLEKYAPAGVLVDENLDVMQFRGHTGAYLAPTPGAATLNVLKLVRPELLVDLKASIQRALKEKLPVTSEPVRLWDNRGSMSVSLDVMPLLDMGARRNCLVILFRDVARDVPVQDPTKVVHRLVGPDGQEESANLRIRELERELLTSREYLQTTVQELEAANEELQSSNEELQSSNEELQSTNEEMETSKEELQSTNEELATVNEELQNRMAQLSVSNDDLQNLLRHMSVVVVIVGMDLRIRRFSESAEKLLNLIAADVGRPIAYLSTALNVPQIEASVIETINSVRTREQRVQCSDGNWYSMRTMPYRTADHAIRGAVIEFVREPSAGPPGAGAIA